MDLTVDLTIAVSGQWVCQFEPGTRTKERATHNRACSEYGASSPTLPSTASVDANHCASRAPPELRVVGPAV